MQHATASFQQVIDIANCILSYQHYSKCSKSRLSQTQSCIYVCDSVSFVVNAVKTKNR